MNALQKTRDTRSVMIRYLVRRRPSCGRAYQSSDSASRCSHTADGRRHSGRRTAGLACRHTHQTHAARTRHSRIVLQPNHTCDVMRLIKAMILLALTCEEQDDSDNNALSVVFQRSVCTT